MTVLWNRLSRMRICFGHQSVGGNLIDGLGAISGGRLDIVESTAPETFCRPVFAHFRVGQNREPLSKFRDFASVINGGVGERVDVAFFKLCYVDITEQTDIHGLFDTYRRTLDALAHAYPAVTFLHVTVPIRRLNGGVVRWMRERWRGCDPEREGQANRHAYNELLRQAYGPSGRLFDLAAEEAVYPDGRSAVTRYRNRILPNLVPDYTNDGGHLNQAAAERIATRLLENLGSLEPVLSHQEHKHKN